MREIRIEADIENLDQVFALIDADMQDGGCTKEDELMFHIAVEEIYSNIAAYAYPNPPGPVKICWEFNQDKKEASIQFWDEGTPYDPLEKPDPDLTLPTELKPVGGLGIYLAKEAVDEVSYAYTKGCNVLTMKKKFTA